MDHLRFCGVTRKKRSLTRCGLFFIIVLCVFLGAYFTVISCGKKGPPTLKTSPPPAQSERVDSNNIEAPQEINTEEKQ
jgi:predicted small lipoprotein YifL